jgi:SAM-dependent methyltransferase
LSELARSFGRVVEEYERGRPGYADAALDEVGLPATAHVLDLAAGTGKLTRQLVRRFERVIAVEPLDGMRAVLERVVPEAEAMRGTAEHIPLDDHEVDAVFVAEALHWFATDEVLAEIARVLRPGGALAVLFNVSDGEWEPPIPSAFWDAYDAGTITKPPEQTVGGGAWRSRFPGPFGPFAESTHANPVVRDREGVLAQMASHSVAAALPDDERERLLAALGTLLPEGRYRHALRTELYVTRLPV